MYLKIEVVLVVVWKRVLDKLMTEPHGLYITLHVLPCNRANGIITLNSDKNRMTAARNQ
jgi:hypothetical protein